MLFKTIIATAVVAVAGVSAQNTTTNTTAFGVYSMRSGTELQYAAWSAAKSGIFSLLPDQKATCDSGSNESYATFSINKNKELYLYSNNNPPQWFYVDRSGMGQGIIGYTTGAQPGPKNAERSGWAITDSVLTFNGVGFQACPDNADGAYQIWLAGANNQPGGNSNCSGIGTHTVSISRPASCLYTQS